MWHAVPKMGIGQRWDGEPAARLERWLGSGVDYVEPNLPLDLRALPAAPVVTHSSELGLASTGALNPALLDVLAEQVRSCSPPWSGEHFALVSPWSTGDLGYNAAPILDRAAIDAGISHVRELSERYACPLALEAGPRYLDVCGWDDHAAILEISRATECGILVDLSHHLVSMLNLGRDPRAALSGPVLERTVELHITGLGRHRDGRHYHDFHGGPVDALAWELLEWTLARAPNLKAITLEHDASVSDDDYCADLERLSRVAAAWRSA
ncbi:MAG TPA: DUF692 family protein [Polyangiaceae bacterium]|nr:DUF692 family protein [Polyangiaceae bacterium]